MKQKRFKAEQIVPILKEAASGAPVAELCRRYGFSEQTFFRWKKKYSGMEVTEVMEMKEMVAENAKLKKIVGNQALQIDSLREALKKKW